jgi:hypothetical protein
MPAFGMRLYWDIGVPTPSDPGLMPLDTAQEDKVPREADQIWFSIKDNFKTPPRGYLVYDQRTGKILLERRSEGPAITKGGNSTTASSKGRSAVWRRLWAR